MTRCGGDFDVEKKRARIASIEVEAGAPAFWNDNARAQTLLKEKSSLEATVGDFERLVRTLDDAVAYAELAGEAGDAATDAEATQALTAARTAIEAMEFVRMLSAPQDRCNAIVEINAGAGGTESMDWAQMLWRMLTRFAERKGWEIEQGDFQPGEEAGIKSGSFIVRGAYAYGHLKPEIGVHRLVRISPFDANARRQTSFASVFVYPEIDDTIKVEINPADVREDVYRSSGAGGQKVNKTSSAVRLTHVPTNIVVAMQNERSQHKNRDMAWKILRSRIYDHELKKQLAEKEKVEATKQNISFGSQIRSYVLAPYRLATDLRTGVKVGDVDAVLDGALDQFIQPYLLGVRRSDRGGAVDDV